MSVFKRFTIRALLALTMVICIALALDAGISSRLTKLQTQFSESPTASILAEGDFEPMHRPRSTWHIHVETKDHSTFHDRVCLRRRLEVNHKRLTLWGTAEAAPDAVCAVQCVSFKSNIDFGLAGVAIDRRNVGDQALTTTRKSFGIPKNALFIPAKNLTSATEPAEPVSQNTRLSELEVIELANAFVKQKLSASELQNYSHQKVRFMAFPYGGEWWVHFDGREPDDSFFIKISDEAGSPNFGGASGAAQRLMQLF